MLLQRLKALLCVRKLMKSKKNMRMRIISTFTILLIVTSLSCQPQAPIEVKMQKVLDEGIRKFGVRAVSAAVIFPDDKIWTGVSGFSHDSVAVNPDMLFAIGSITKNMVAALVLKLVEEKALLLEDPISKWLPPYPHIDSTITIRQLLNHTSGIYMFWENQKIWDDLKKDRTKVWTPDEILSYIKEPYFAPGEGFRYSNTNYLLLAMIIKKVTGSTLSNEMQKRFWEPLNIKNAFLAIEQTIPDNQVHVFGDNFNNDGSVQDLTFLPRASHDSITYGSAGLFMTAEDLARWCQNLFEGKILSRQSLDEMLKFNGMRRVANMSDYGLGVQQFIRKISAGKKAIGHAGGNIGTIAYMIYLPKYHISIVVMTNDFNSRCNEHIVRKLIKIVS
jgi:D-alanyl-D-alanine carboxypeptidase